MEEGGASVRKEIALLKRKSEKIPKKNSSGKGSLAYALGMISYNAEYAVVAQLTYALTESYALSALTVGMIFLVSRMTLLQLDFLAYL